MEEMEIDLKEYLDIIWSKKWLILGITLLATLISGLVSFFVLQPVYEASTTIMIGKSNTSEQSIKYDDVMLNQKLVNTYSEIIKSNTVLEEVVSNLKLGQSATQLKENVTVNPIGDTEIIEIKVNNSDPVLATNIANDLSEVSMENVKEIMKIDNVQVIDRAEVPNDPVKPNEIMNIIIAAVLGFMIGIGIVFLREYLDNTITSPNDIEKYLDLSVIGVIPLFSKEDLQ